MTILEQVANTYVREITRMEWWARTHMPAHLARTIVQISTARLFVELAHGVPSDNGPYYRLYELAANEIDDYWRCSGKQIPPKWRRTVPLPPLHELDELSTTALLIRFCHQKVVKESPAFWSLVGAIYAYFPGYEILDRIPRLHEGTTELESLLALVAAQLVDWTPLKVTFKSEFTDLAADQRARQTDWVNNQAYLRKEHASGLAKQDHYPS